MSLIQRPKGTQDILPDEARGWQWLEAQSRRVLSAAGYGEIRTPVLEHTELFCRGVGEATDIVSKEMFSFERSERGFTLRPEGTAGVVRAFIEQGLHRLPKPVKLFYLGPMFRYERPQEGRQRQFHQLGVEVLGIDTPLADAEAITLALEVLSALGISNYQLSINNVGNPESREAFRDGLKALLAPYLPQLCPDCQRRFELNPLRMLDCKVPTCQAVYQSESVQGFLQTFEWDEASTASFNELKAILTHLGIAFEVDPQLVRGLDYYTGTVFEISSVGIGAQSAICGGGRYNGLVQTLGGPETSAVGWAMGIERLMKLITPPEKSGLDYYLVTDQPAEALKLAQTLRKKGKTAELDLTGKAFGKQLATASKREACHALVLGKEEVETQSLQVKNLKTSEQTTVQQADWLASF